MTALCLRISNSAWFRNAVILLILVNGVAMGLETWPAVFRACGWLLVALNTAVQALFVVEIAIRIAAHGRRPLRFFRDAWNVFDFTVVAVSLLPAAGPLATVARLARVLRVGRLVSGMPELRLIIGTMLRSIPSMGHVVMLLGLLIYVYGVIGFHLFGVVDPQHWGTLGRAAHTLFVIITLEGWVEIMRASASATPWAWVYYLSFIVIAVFVVINLFIAVVINNLEKVRKEQSGTGEPALAGDLRQRLEQLAGRIDDLGTSVRALADSCTATAANEPPASTKDSTRTTPVVRP